jgi:nitroimidazol reductase NimA-like FMN-containing flavoprotein (pyridoxamine 5'-phosphate oxidase superfamily)
MIEVKELSENEIALILSRVGYGHLACCRGYQPYVVPVHYAFDDGDIIIYTTEGKKTEFIKENPNVCLQIEEVIDNQQWQSVIIDGSAVQLDSGAERDRALELIVAVNPTLSPAVSIRWMDNWVRENIEVVYRITPTATSGRRSVDRLGSAHVIPTRGGGKDNII